MSKKYLGFNEIKSVNKTKVFLVKSGDVTIGSVSWYSQWRKYCFFPYEKVLFDASCLQEIIDFLDKTNKEHKDARKPVKENDPHHGCERTLSIAEMEKLKEDAIIDARRLFSDVKGDDDE